MLIDILKIGGSLALCVPIYLFWYFLLSRLGDF